MRSKNAAKKWIPHLHSRQEVDGPVLEVPVFDPERINEIVSLHSVVIAGVVGGVRVAHRIVLENQFNGTVVGKK